MCNALEDVRDRHVELAQTVEALRAENSKLREALAQLVVNFPVDPEREPFALRHARTLLKGADDAS